MQATEVTAILYFKNDALQYQKDRPNVKFIYPLTPDAKVIILNNTKKPLRDPLQNFTDYSHLRIIASVRAYERELHPIIKKINTINPASKETLISLLHVSLCSFYYIRYMLRSTGPWLLYDGKKWVETEKLDIAVNILLKRIINQNVCHYKIRQNTPQIGKRIISLINALIINKIKNKNCIITTGINNYGLNNIIKKIHLVDKNACVIYNAKCDYKSIFRSLRSLMFIYLPFYDKKPIAICSVKKPKKNFKHLLNHFFSSKPYKLSPFSILLKTYLINNITYTESVLDNLKMIVKSVKPKNVIAHHLRWLDQAALGQCTLDLGIKTYLISHGSQPPSENSPSKYELQNVSWGLCVSPFTTTTIAQSPIAEKTINEFMPNLSIEKYQPIMWGYKTMNLSRRKNTKFKILHAGSYKVLGCRPWIHETSNEFVNGLQHLVSAISDIDNAELIIRIRDNEECELSSLNKLLPESNNCRIKTDGSFQDDLNQADLLISFSSTTIEEALNARKPVALFGGSDRYRHLPGSSKPPVINNRSAVYHLTIVNISNMLKGIMDSHINKPLTENEILDYVWPKSVPGQDQFISDVVSIN